MRPGSLKPRSDPEGFGSIKGENFEDVWIVFNSDENFGTLERE